MLIELLWEIIFAYYPLELHTVELLVPDPSPSEVEIAIVKLRKYKWLGSDESPAELIQAGDETVLRSMNSLTPFGIRTNCLMSGVSAFVRYLRKKWDCTSAVQRLQERVWFS
jgi:hypothetical protein